MRYAKCEIFLRQKSLKVREFKGFKEFKGFEAFGESLKSECRLTQPALLKPSDGWQGIMI